MPNITRMSSRYAKICESLNTWCKKWRMVINCNKNKTEAIILKHNKKGLMPTTISKLSIGNKTIEYVKETKVLGLILDESLSFTRHATDKLKNCWYTWYNLTLNTTRTRGLNITSLTLLFKSIVLSKLLYASPIWLEPNFHIFRDFWARALLKISGAQYHPPRVITEVALGLPSLKLITDVNAIKFISKCLSDDTNMASCIFQLEGSPSHPYYRHIRLIKDYMAWKSNIRRNTHSISLIDYPQQSFVYSKLDMEKFKYHVWTKDLRNCLDDTFLENNDTISLEVSPNKILFSRSSTRQEDTNIMDFIHGHSLKFKNFAHTVKRSASPVCSLCGVENDSPSHQLFHCEALTGSERTEILKQFKEQYTWFKLKLLTTHDTKLLAGFKTMASFILSSSDISSN